MTFFASNTADKAVKVKIECAAELEFSKSWEIGEMSLNGGAVDYNTVTDFLPFVRCSAQFGQNPTTGNVTVILAGI